MKIALVHTADQGGGAESNTYVLHKSLLELGHDSTLFVGQKYSSDPTVKQIEKFRCFPGLLRSAHFLERKFGLQYLYHPWFRNLDRVIGQVDVVHFHSIWSGREGYADIPGLAKLSKLYPSLITLHDWWMLTGHCSHPAIGCERWKTGCGNCPDLQLAPAIDVDGTAWNWKRKHRYVQNSEICVTTVSEWLKGEVRQSPIFENKRIETVFNSIDASSFFPRDKGACRQELGLPQDAFIVMIAGQSVEGTARRGTGAVDYALEALNLSKTNPFLLAVGKSSQNVIDRWKGDGVAAPFQTDPKQLAKYYCAADVVLVASLWETFGRVPAEAQMCGIPVAAFATGGIPEIVVHGETGLLVPRLDSAALGNALHTLYVQSTRRNELGNKANVRATQLFSQQVVAEKYVQLYRREIALRKSTAKS